MFYSRAVKIFLILGTTALLGACETPAPTAPATPAPVTKKAKTTTSTVTRTQPTAVAAATPAPVKSPPMYNGARQTGTNFR